MKFAATQNKNLLDGVKMNKEQQEFIDKKMVQFYKECTDGVDEENGFYDAQFEGEKPSNVESFIRTMFREYTEDSQIKPTLAEIITCLNNIESYSIDSDMPDKQKLQNCEGLAKRMCERLSKHSA